MSNEILKNDTSITLSWTTGTGTTNVQISKYQDFSTSTEYDGTTSGTSLAHTLTGGTGKYYWRWRKTTDGTNYDAFREINSFIYAGLDGDLSLSNDKWTVVGTASVSDKYEFEVNPLDWETPEEHINRSQERNLNGDLLSEWNSEKANIILDFSSQSYIGTAAKAEFQRFYNKHDSFYVTKRFDAQDGSNYLYKIWEVEFKSPLRMERTGNLTLDLIEV